MQKHIRIRKKFTLDNLMGILWSLTMYKNRGSPFTTLVPLYGHIVMDRTQMESMNILDMQKIDTIQIKIVIVFGWKSIGLL